MKTGRISDTMPKAGRIRMYTSGWPKSQNMCCQRTGSPPCAGSKKFAPNEVSIISSHSATPMTGIANSIRKLTIRIIQTNTGMRMRVMPGARMFRIVTMKFTAEASDAMPAICRPSE